MRRLTIRHKIILLTLALNVALTAILSVAMYRNEREAVLRGTDEKLLSGATNIAALFPDDYHARITGPGTVTDAEYQSYVKRLTDLARTNKFQRLYTCMELNGQIVTTAMGADLTNPLKVIPFLAVHPQESDKIRRAFAERKPVFAEYADELGEELSAFVPFVTSNGKVFVAGADVSIDFIDAILGDALRKVVLLSLLVSVALVFISVVVADRISRPIRDLAGLTRTMSDHAFSLTEQQGQWLQRVSHGARDEMGELASAFIQMDGMLKQYITNLRETTAAKERIESELSIARSIQDSFLHKLFPPFTDRPEFELFAALEPAKGVGGDLYDFVLLGDELYFCVGDVAGKGMPAALLMVVTQTLMRAAAQQSQVDPATMLVKVNADILEKNDMLMFVTMFCGVLTLSTGELRYSNAGHNPPLIRRRNGEVEWLKLPDGMVLGVMPDMKYATSTITLERGDTLLTYTDGVTEAHNPQSALYSDDQLFALVVAQPDSPPAELVASVMRSVKTHASTAPQSDDITILALRFGRS